MSSARRETIKNGRILKPKSNYIFVKFPTYQKVE